MTQPSAVGPLVWWQLSDADRVLVSDVFQAADRLQQTCRSAGFIHDRLWLLFWWPSSRILNGDTLPTPLAPFAELLLYELREILRDDDLTPAQRYLCATLACDACGF